MRKLHIPARYRSAARRKKRLRRLPLVMLLAVLLGMGAIFSEWGLSSISPELTEEAAALSHRFAEMDRRVAEAHGCAFFDAASVACASETDCLHMDAESHAALGKALAAPVRSLLG